jgi:hypothetical protein
VSHEDAEQVYRQIEEKVKQLAKSLWTSQRAFFWKLLILTPND